MRPIVYPDSYLVLELTNRCVLACTHCIQGFRSEYAHFDGRGFIERRLVSELFADLERNGMRFHHLILFWLGEPLLHPDFLEIYDDALSRTGPGGLFDRLMVHTNAVLLDREVARAVARRGDRPQQWHVSLDADSAETYRRIKGRDRFSIVERNVRELIDARRRAGAGGLRLVLQFIVRRENRHEAGAFAARWTERLRRAGAEAREVGYAVPEGGGDCIFFRQLDALDAADQPEANRIYDEVLRERGIATRGGAGIRERITAIIAGARRRVCSGPWKSPVVSWDGRVTVCTRDSGLELCAGDLHDRPLSALWWGNERLDWHRRLMIDGDDALPGLCRGCIIPASANYTGITEDEIRTYLRRSARS